MYLLPKFTDKKCYKKQYWVLIQNFYFFILLCLYVLCARCMCFSVCVYICSWLCKCMCIYLCVYVEVWNWFQISSLCAFHFIDWNGVSCWIQSLVLTDLAIHLSQGLPLHRLGLQVAFSGFWDLNLSLYFCSENSTCRVTSLVLSVDFIY